MARLAARLPTRLLGLAARAALGLVAAALTFALVLELGACALAWRLAEGPVPLGALLRRAGLVPEEVAAGEVALSWAGWRGGPKETVDVTVHGLRVRSLPGVEALRLDEGSVVLAPAPLLRGVLAPLTVRLSGLDAALLPSGGGASVSPPWFDISRLLSLDARDVRVSYAGTGTGTGWSAQASVAEMRQDPDGSATGGVIGTVTAGPVSVPVQARIGRGADRALHIGAQAGQVRPAALAAALPALADLAALDAPLTLAATVDLTERLRPSRVAVQATAGAGTVALGGATIPLAGASGEAVLAWENDALRAVTLTRLDATVPSPSGRAPTALRLAATAVPRGSGGSGGWRVQGEVAFDHAAAADLPRLWPPAASPHARRWVTENITAGTARAGRIALTLDVAEGLGDARLAAISGGFEGEDLTIHWLRPVPPVEHARATLAFEDPDTIRIAVLGGRQGAIKAQGGSVVLDGLAGDDQTAQIALDLAGPLADAVALLAHPRLKLLSERPLPFAVAAGRFAGTLRLRLPLAEDLDSDQIALDAHARLSGVALRDVAIGRDLTHGALDLDVTTEGLQLAGRARFAGVPARLAAAVDFRHGPPSQVQVKVDATGRVTAAALEREGLDARGVLSGAGLLSVHYAHRRDGGSEVALRADLGEAAVATPLWRKPLGAPATASARLVLRDDHLVGVEELHAQGAGLLLQARAEVVDGRPAALRIDRLVLDRTEASGEVRLPAACGGAVCVRLAGPVLDLSEGLGRIARSGGQAREGGRAAGTPWRADLRFGRVLLRGGRALGPVQGEARSDGTRLVSARLEAPGVQGALREQGRGRVASLRVADLGALLREIGATDLLHGGRLSLDGRFDDAARGSPFAGTMDVTEFTVQKEVVLGKALQALTLYGILDAIRGPGLFFSRAVVPVRYVGNVLELREARAFSAALGVTAKGWLDLERSTMLVQGTVVPAYVLNSLLGRLPVVGRLFTAERGGGLIAADVTLHGPIDDPGVTVNPLSLLTPGALRGLFDIFK